MASLHTVITKYPSKIDDINVLEEYIVSTLKLFEQYPPSTLSSLNEKWLDKCKLIEMEMMEEKRQREEAMLRQRRNRKYQQKGGGGDFSEDNDNNNNNKLVRRNFKTSLFRYRRANGKQAANRLLVGLTFTVGVAAFAVYAINSSASQTPDILSKFYHLLTS